MPVPIWRGPALSEKQEKEFRAGWTPLTSLEQAAARSRIFKYPPGTKRDFARDFAFLRKGAKLDQVSISDPYALKAQRNLNALQRFLAEIRARVGVWPAKIEIRVRADSIGQREEFEKWFMSQGASGGVKPVIARGAERRDFHDRQVVFIPNGAVPNIRTVVLLAGGVDRYMEQECETVVIVHRAQ